MSTREILTAAAPVIIIEGIASPFDRAEARRRPEAALYRIEAASPARARDPADPSAGLT